MRSASLVFNSVGSLDKAAMLALTPPQTLPVTINLPVFPATGANANLAIKVDFTNSTQLSSSTSEKRTVADGYSAGQLDRFVVGSDGVIQGRPQQWQDARPGPGGIDQVFPIRTALSRWATMPGRKARPRAAR